MGLGLTEGTRGQSMSLRRGHRAWPPCLVRLALLLPPFLSSAQAEFLGNDISIHSPPPALYASSPLRSPRLAPMPSVGQGAVFWGCPVVPTARCGAGRSCPGP